MEPSKILKSENQSDMPKCDVPHCNDIANSRQHGSFCDPHYQIKYRGGDPYTRIITGSRIRLKCWVEDCPKRANTQGLCNAHNKRAKEGKLPVPEELGVKLNPPCTFDTCEKLQTAGGYCKGHYNQLKKGVTLQPLREWGVYSTGEYTCEFRSCRKPAISQGLCEGHKAKLHIYKITKDELFQLHEVGKCYNPGCEETARLNIDHNHDTGKVRGLLCGPCNTSLGFLKEDRERIAGLIGYLDEFDS